MSNLYAESTEYSLSAKSTNTLKIRFIATENISGNKNTINFKINIWTKYRINGTWYFTIKVNNECFNTTCYLSHGTNYSSGETTIREGSVTLNYNNKTSLPIYIMASMDYYSIKYGPSSTKISIPTLNTSLPLSKINTKPKKPEVKLLDCDYKYWRKDNDGNDVYLVKDCIGAYITDKSLINIDKEDGNNVDAYIAVYDAPPWEKIAEKNTQYLTGDKRVNIKGYERGHHFYVAAYVKDKCGEKSNESYINIYKNTLPEKINDHQIKDKNTYNILNSKYLNNDYVLLWKKVSDKEISDLTYNLYLSKNNSEYILIDNKEIKYKDDNFLYYIQNIDNDPEGTSYKYKICSYDGLEESTAYYTETYYKNNRPTAPKNIMPNNEYRFGNTKITWDPSRDPDRNGIKKYDIYINDEKIESTSNLYCYYNIPNEDEENTKYTIKIQATDIDDGVSDFGIAEFYKERKINSPKWILPKENYFEKSIRLEWEKINTKCEYEIEISINNNEWEPFIKTQRNYYIHNIENIEKGTKIKYRIRCKTKYQITEFTESIQCAKNNTPLQPIIEYPLQNSIIYSKNPRICFAINNEKDNQGQIIYIKYNDIIYNNIKNKEMFSIVDSKYSTKKNVVFTCPNLNEGPCKIYIYVNDSLIDSDYSILNLNIEYLNLNISKEDIISELLFKDISKKINTIRNSYQLNDYSFSDIKNSIIKTNHIKELQDSILELRQKINNYDATNNYKLLENVSEINKNDYIFANLLNEIIEIIKQP